MVLGGDYNVIPENIDARFPLRWKNDALFQPESRAAYRALLFQGYYDSFRTLHPDKMHGYTFWDYFQGSFEQDNGIRIDHLLASPEAADRLQKCWVNRKLREREKASDHTPIMAEYRA